MQLLLTDNDAGLNVNISFMPLEKNTVFIVKTNELCNFLLLIVSSQQFDPGCKKLNYTAGSLYQTSGAVMIDYFLGLQLYFFPHKITL